MEQPVRVNPDVIAEHLEENKPLSAATAKMIWLINKHLKVV